MELENYLIVHCSPTLASLKTANLFNISFADEAELDEQIREWNLRLEQKGINILVLCRKRNSGLVYVCRKSRLQEDLNRPGVARFLTGYGYQGTDMRAALATLSERLNQSDTFPHEIGVFLGYPLGDVIGFIRNGGQNCKCCGYWKVYCNECEAVKAFARYKKCTDLYERLWKQGRTVWQLTVAA